MSRTGRKKASGERGTRGVRSPKSAGRGTPKPANGKRGDATARASRSRPDPALRQWLPALRHPAGLGLAAMVAVVEGTGAGWNQAVAVADRLTPIPRSRAARSAEGGLRPEHTNSRAARALLRASRTKELARVLGALGSAHRLRILFKLLEGAATYRTLQKVTGLKAGPLYHHISQLRLAELVGPKQRDLYELTRAGRNVVVVASVLGALSRDRRPRPAPVISGGRGRA